MSKDPPAGQDRDQTIGVGLPGAGDLAGLSGLDFFRGLMERRFPAPPFSQTARFEPVPVEDGKVVFAGVPSAQFHNPMGTVHGGWIAMLLDTVTAGAVRSARPAGKAYTAVEMKTSFIPAVREDSGPLTAEGTLPRLGSKIASAEGRIYDGRQRLIAHGPETCMIWAANGGQR